MLASGATIESVSSCEDANDLFISFANFALQQNLHLFIHLHQLFIERCDSCYIHTLEHLIYVFYLVLSLHLIKTLLIFCF